MEAAGTAVGAISLGMTLCDGIVQYCHAWKHQDEDVRALRDLATGLRNVLTDVDARLQHQPAISIAAAPSLSNSLQACRDQISQAVHISNKYSTGQTIGTKGKLKDLVHRMTFPFEKNALGQLRDIMVAFRGNVDTALELLNIDLTVAGTEAMQRIGSDTSKQHNELIQEVRNATTLIKSSSFHSLDLCMSKHEQNMTSLIADHVDGSTLILKHRVSESSANLLSRIDDTSCELLRISTEQRKQHDLLCQIQDLLAADVDQYHSLSALQPQSRQKKVQTSLQRREISFSHCTCAIKASKRFDTVLYWSKRMSIMKKTEAFIIHERCCPLWYTSKKHTTYQMRLRIAIWHMFGTLEVKLSPYAVIARYKISPSLLLRPVVPDNAPAFRVLKKMCRDCERSVHIADYLRDLRIVFQSGQGSPWDITQQGHSLLEAAHKMFLGLDPTISWQIARLFHDLDIEIDECIEGESIMKYIPQDAVSNSNESANQKQQKFLEYLLWCVQREVNFSSVRLYPVLNVWNATTQPLPTFRFTTNTLYAYEDFAPATECGILSIAVLRRDLLQTQKLLRQRPALLFEEKNAFGQSPLFLAVGWPKGLKILLEAGKGHLVNDSCAPHSNITPLDYAIAIECLESMKLLTSQSLSFTFQWSYCIATSSLGPNASERLLEMIVEKCRLFHEYSLARLPEKLIRNHQLTDFEIFHAKSRLVCQYFRKKKFPIPVSFGAAGNYFCPAFGGIFHRSWVSLETARAFFHAGFTDVDIACKQLTPLMCRHSAGRDTSLYSHNPQLDIKYKTLFTYVDFLVQKGARLDRKIPPLYIRRPISAKDGILHTERSPRVIHQLASIAWSYIIEAPVDIHLVADLGFSTVWRNLFASIEPDSCDCACSSNGCRPISLALKMAVLTSISSPELSSKPNYDVYQWKQTEKGLRRLAILLEKLQGQFLVSDVIRFLTFTALELTHTCCEHNTQFQPDIFENETSCGRNMNFHSEVLDNSLEDELGETSNDYSTDVLNTTRFRNPFSSVLVWFKPDTEIREIREEEAAVIGRLDFLVDEFMKEFEDLKIPLSEFIQTRWPERMRVELLAKDELEESQRQAIVDLGVKILERDEPEWEVENKPPEDPDSEYDEWIRGLERSLK